jgi:hypothetical protein
VPDRFYRRESLIDLCIRREHELSAAAPPALVPRDAVWKYYDHRNPPPEGWATPGFDDSAWESGPAELGYGDGDEATLLDYGPDPDHKNLTAWFRHRFEAGDLSRIHPLRLSLLCDDGAVVYLNGREILRHGIPEGPVSPTTLAMLTVSGQDELIARVFMLDPAGLPLREGANTLAVEVHQNDPPSSDLSFALELLAAAPVPDPLEGLDLESAATTLGDALPPVVKGWVEEARRRAAP